MIQALLNLATRCRVMLADSSSRAQTLQAALLDGEPKDGLEHIEPFGFTACPMPGAEGVALFFGGDRSHGVVLAVGDRRFRIIELAPGESAQYNSSGHHFRLYHDRAELVTPRYVVKADDEVVFDTPKVRMTGDVEAAGDMTDRMGAGGKSMAAMRDTYDKHTHPENNAPGGNTAPPTQKTTD